MPNATPTAILPVQAASARIKSALTASGCLVLAAPPGTGKSTQVPRFLADRPGQVWVLQPRRIAARALAARVAEELGEPLGKTAGYQVRFESAAGPETRILFQTYGTFRQRLLRDPNLPGVHTVVLDEFHERAWEADLALLWCRALRRASRPDLRVAVMSATLDAAALTAYWPEAAMVEIAGRAFPVEIRHQAPRPQEYLPQQVLRALKNLAADGWSGSALVFLPGAGEIRQAAEALSGWSRTAGLQIHELHGALPLAAQQVALGAAARGAALILATNVAETSLTVDGVTAVIDTGLHRVAAYDPDRDLNTLYLQSITRANAIQRSGRAGRTAPGICVRLWDADREAHMVEALAPEIRRVELSEPALTWHGLCDGRPEAADAAWPTLPEADRWQDAEAKLQRLDALRAGKITALGKALLQWPAPPALARVLQDASALADPELQRQTAAMAACLAAGKSVSGLRGISVDLFTAAEELAAAGRNADREAVETFRQFHRNVERLAPKSARSVATDPEIPLRRRAAELFLPVYSDRLAARVEGAQSFALADGRRGVAAGIPPETRLLLALEIHESGGKDRHRQTTLPLHLPVQPAWVTAMFPTECRWEPAEEFDPRRQKVVREDRLTFRGLVLDRRESRVAAEAEAGDLLAEQLIRGEIELPRDEEDRQWIHRIRLAHRVCPESGMPALDVEDWRLLYHDLCAGKKSVRELQDASLSAALREYLGPALTAFLEREAPVSVKLPAGRRHGKITYFENAPPELSARLGDLLGMQGVYKILRGRVEVLYDILAPNFRTVQKTANLTSFWQNTYPEIKKELKRRYPRHPWP